MQKTTSLDSNQLHENASTYIDQTLCSPFRDLAHMSHAGQELKAQHFRGISLFLNWPASKPIQEKAVPPVPALDNWLLGREGPREEKCRPQQQQNTKGTHPPQHTQHKQGPPASSSKEPLPVLLYLPPSRALPILYCTSICLQSTDESACITQ